MATTTKTWYVKGDETKTDVDFETYKIQEDTDFIQHKAIEVTWTDQETVAVTFNININNGKWYENE